MPRTTVLNFFISLVYFFKEAEENKIKIYMRLPPPVNLLTEYLTTVYGDY